MLVIQNIILLQFNNLIPVKGDNFKFAVAILAMFFMTVIIKFIITAIPLFYNVQEYIFFQAMRLEIWQRIRKHIFYSTINFNISASSHIRANESY